MLNQQYFLKFLHLFIRHRNQRSVSELFNRPDIVQKSVRMDQFNCPRHVDVQCKFLPYLSHSFLVLQDLQRHQVCVLPMDLQRVRIALLVHFNPIKLLHQLLLVVLIVVCFVHLQHLQQIFIGCVRQLYLPFQAELRGNLVFYWQSILHVLIFFKPEKSLVLHFFG